MQLSNLCSISFEKYHEIGYFIHFRWGQKFCWSHFYEIKNVLQYENKNYAKEFFHSWVIDSQSKENIIRFSKWRYIESAAQNMWIVKWCQKEYKSQRILWYVRWKNLGNFSHGRNLHKHEKEIVWKFLNFDS